MREYRLDRYLPTRMIITHRVTYARHRRRSCRRRRRRLRYVVDWVNVNLALSISTPCLNPV